MKSLQSTLTVCSILRIDQCWRCKWAASEKGIIPIGNCNGMFLAGTAIKSYSIHCYRFVLATVAKACLGTLAWERDQVTSKRDLYICACVGFLTDLRQLLLSRGHSWAAAACECRSLSVHCSYLGSPRRSITGMSDRELFTPSEEESDSRGSYETPIRYKDYVGLSKSSSAVKRRRYSPLVLQTSYSSGEDDYPPLPKPKTDRRKSEVNGRRSQVLSSTIERTQVKCRRQGEWMCWYQVTWWYRESIVRVKQTVERCPTPCWQVWEANKLFWEQAWGKCKQHFRWFYPIKKEGAGSRRSEGKRLVYVQWLCRSHSVFFSGPLGP